MKITMIRHAKVNYNWKTRCNSKEFDTGCLEYDHSPIYTKQTITCVHEGKEIHTSSLQRTHDTAKLVFGEKEFNRSDLFNEVYINSSFDTSVRLPLLCWNIMGRIQWFFNCSRQKETRRDTFHRVRKAIRFLEKKNMDCIVVSHGFFLRILILELRKRGYVSKSGIYRFYNLAVNEMEKSKI